RLQIEQAMQFAPEVVLSENCEQLEHVAGSGDEATPDLTRLVGATGTEYWTRTVIVTAGPAAFAPRTPCVEAIDEWEGRGLHYFVKQKSAFAGKRVVIVGGGDSALDWTLGLQDTVDAPLTLVHRRDRFRAVESSVEHMRELAAGAACASWC